MPLKEAAHEGCSRFTPIRIAVYWVYRVAAALLLAVAALTAMTGARTSVVWFKVCPVLLGACAGLLLAASAV